MFHLFEGTVTIFGHFYCETAKYFNADDPFKSLALWTLKHTCALKGSLTVPYFANGIVYLFEKCSIDDFLLLNKKFNFQTAFLKLLNCVCNLLPYGNLIG